MPFSSLCLLFSFLLRISRNEPPAGLCAAPTCCSEGERPTGGCPVVTLGAAVAGVSPYSVFSSPWLPQRQKLPPSKGFPQAQGHPLFQKCSGHLALCQAHAKHLLHICYFMAGAISSVVIFHFCKRFPAGFPLNGPLP